MAKKSSPRDPNLDHPAVKLYIDICHSTPNHIQREAIAAAVKKLDLYEEILRQFMLEGRPPQKVNWTLERYTNAMADRGRPKPVDAPRSTLISTEEEAWIRSRKMLI